ncbi:MAG: SDR family oxidoreductase [Candidatus Binatia bacterium]
MGRDWSIRGKVCVVTGATSGIGRVTALKLARRGAHVVLTARSREKGQPVADAIRAETGNDRVEVLPLELGSLQRVRDSAAALLARDTPIHVLINNAGLAGQRGVTDDGFELQFGVNHLGPFLFTTLLLDRLRDSAPARVVTVASKAHFDARQGIDFEAVRRSTPSLTGLPEYAVSKLANVLFSRELARQLADARVTTYALHPGVVATDVWRRIPTPVAWVMKRFMLSSAEGAATTLYCATEPSLAGASGRYYDGCRERQPSRVAQDERLARELWTRSERMTGRA